jgi:hypothetical protein
MTLFVRLRPPLLTRLGFAPASAIHAVGAWLHLAPEADLPDPKVAAILDETHPRSLLRAAIPEAPARLYRALGRAGDRVRNRSFYQRLATVCTGPAADVLWGDTAINPELLAFAEKLLTLDPAVLKLRHLLSRSIDSAERLQATVLFLRAHRVLADNDLELPPQARLPALAKRLQSVLDRIAAPDPRFDLKPPLRIVRSVGELRETGKELENCLSDFAGYGAEYPVKLASGELVFVTCVEPQLAATLVRTAPGLYQLGSMSGPQNGMVPKEASDAFHQHLRESGVTLLASPVSWSLGWMLRPERPGRRRGLDRLADDIDGELDDYLAA